MLFNNIGKTYNKTRAADERIMTELHRLLGLQKGAIIADVGAGTDKGVRSPVGFCLEK
jgi:hypothetical protein